MPELPEVEQAARTLGEQVVGATFSGQVRCLWPRTIGSVPAEAIGAQLQGVTISAWRRRATWSSPAVETGLWVRLRKERVVSVPLG